ncbi:MAG: hypothetical protein EXR69_00950 [Myxococcales bacterium]|nr:hypothetical protein [Myxococcales bacterium]
MSPSGCAPTAARGVAAAGLAVAGLAAYALTLKGLAFLVLSFAGDASRSRGLGVQPVLPPERHAEFVLLFVLVFSPALYAVVRWTRDAPDPAATSSPTTWPGMICAAGFTFLCAAPLEIVVDSAFVAATGRPCWEYRVWPLHRGYTSGVGAAMWPMYGAFVYAFHAAIRSRRDLVWLHGLAARAGLVAVEAMVLEIAANAFALVGYGCFYFYYFPSDLENLTTMQILVPYFGAGVIGLTLLEQVQRLPHPAVVGVLSWVAGLVLVFGAG